MNTKKYYLPYNPNTKQVLNTKITVFEMVENPLFLTLNIVTYEQAKVIQKAFKKRITFRIIELPTTYID